MAFYIKPNTKLPLLPERAGVRLLVRLGIFLLLATCAGQAQAQTYEELFRQKKTREKYLVQQLTALQVYAGYLKQGYNIASKGINTVKSIKNGEFSLHRDFFNSLKIINPVIRNHVKTAEIVTYQSQIIKLFGRLNQLEELSEQEHSYIRRVKLKVLDEGSKDLEELFMVITTGALEMTDDERMNRLDKIYGSMQDRYRFTESFINDAIGLSEQRKTGKRELNTLKKLNDIQ